MDKIELTRTYTADQLEAIGVPYDKVLTRDSEDEHRWYILWRIVFRDPADNTTWAVLRAEDTTEMGEIPWWYAYDSEDKIEAKRVEVRQVLRDEWYEVTAEPEAGADT